MTLGILSSDFGRSSSKRLPTKLLFPVTSPIQTVIAKLKSAWPSRRRAARKWKKSAANVLKAMSHDATFPATCLATLTTALRCKLQRGCHTLATFAATCNFICPRNHFVCPRNSLINSRKFDLCQVSPPRLASVNLSDGRREPASESKEHCNVFGTGSRTGGRDPEEEKAEKHLDDTVGCSKRGERLFPPGKQQHTLTQW